MGDWKNKPTDSGILDFDSNLKRKVRESRGSVPVQDDHEYTPITRLTELGPAISAIKRGQDRTADAVDNLNRIVKKDIQPKLGHVHEGFIRLETEHKDTKRRVKSLESDTKDVLAAPLTAHDCYHEDDIRNLEEGHRGTLAEIITVKTAHIGTRETLDKNVERIDGRSKTFTGIAVSVVLFVLAAAGGFSAAFYGVQANVEHLADEQIKLRSRVSDMKESHISASSKMEKAIVSVEEVAEKMEKARVNPLDVVWCDLSIRERRRQMKIRGAKKVPRRRCP